MTLVVLLFACRGPVLDPGASELDSAVELPGPGHDARLSAGQVARHLSDALAELPDADTLIDAYLGLLDQGDALCPGGDAPQLDTPSSGCTADSGTHFAGEAAFFHDSHADGTVQVRGVYGDFWIESADGESLSGGGHAVVGQGDGQRFEQLGGAWTWTAGDASIHQTVNGSWAAEHYAGRSVELRGAIGRGGAVIVVDDLWLDAACGWGPTGAMRLHDPAGGWYRMELADCEPCAMVTVDGAELAEGCLDLSGLLDLFGEAG